MDSDADVYVRVVRKAAEEDLICGNVFLSRPDFEFSNFELHELCDVALDVANRKDITAPAKVRLEKAAEGAASGEEFIRRVRNASPEMAFLAKGESWGKALAEYAMKNPQSGNGETRPFIQAAQQIMNAKHVKYTLSREQSRIDPTALTLVRRDVVE